MAVHDLGRQDGVDLLGKVLPDILLLRLFQLLHGQLAHAVFRQLPLQPGAHSVLAGDEGTHGVVDGIQLLSVGHARLLVHRLMVHGVQVVEAAHPDHEELVQVAGEDGHELQPLQQRHRFVGGLFQHPLVEPQPGQLPVLGEAQFSLVITHAPPLLPACAADSPPAPHRGWRQRRRTRTGWPPPPGWPCRAEWYAAGRGRP